MTYYPQKNNNKWSAKHFKFCLDFKLKSVAQNFWQWLLEQPEHYGCIEFSFKDFDKFIYRRLGHKHARHYLKKQFDKLIFLGVIEIKKSFTNNDFRIKLYKPKELFPSSNNQEKKLEEEQVSCEKEASNQPQLRAGYNNSSHVYNAKNSIDSFDTGLDTRNTEIFESTDSISEEEVNRRLKILKLCAKHGINFNPRKFKTRNLYLYKERDVILALNYYDSIKNFISIFHSQGWLIDCLKNRYWEDLSYQSDNFFADLSKWINSYP